jgi:exosortase
MNKIPKWRSKKEAYHIKQEDCMRITDRMVPIWKAFFASPNKWFIVMHLSLLAVLPIVAYYQDFIQVFNLALSSEETQYILLVPVFTVIFFYIKRRAFLIQRRNTIPQDLIGISLCITAILTYVWGSYSIYSLQLHLLSLPIVFAGITLLLFGTDALKITIFPIALLAFLSPLPVLFMHSYGSYLTNFLAQAVSFVLGPFMPIELSLIPMTTLSSVSVGGEPLAFTIGAACAGINFLVSFLFLSLVFGYLAIGSIGKKTILIILSIFLAFSLNIFRIALMLVIGRFYGMESALGFFHLPGGMILLSLGSLLILVLGSKMLRFPFFEKTGTKKEHCVSCNQENDICITCGRINRGPKVKINWKRLGIIVLFLIIAADIIVLASTATYNSAIVGEEAAINLNTSTGSFQSFQELTGYQAKFTYRETPAEHALKLTYVGHYFLTRNGITTGSTEAILEVADIQSKFHTWEGCLHYQSIPINIERTEYSTFEDGNNLVIIETITADAPTTNQQIIVTYWFDSLYLKLDEVSNVYAVKISLIDFIQKPADAAQLASKVEATKAKHLAITNELETFWSKSKNQNNTFAVDLYKNKEGFAAVTFGLLALSGGALGIEWFVSKRKAKMAINNLSSSDKLLLEQILTSSKDNEVMDDVKIREFEDKGIIKQRIFLKDSHLYAKWVKR